MYRLGCMKNFKICATKDPINRVKRQPTEWGKVFANHVADKGLTSRIYGELIKLNNNKNNSTQK